MPEKVAPAKMFDATTRGASHLFGCIDRAHILLRCAMGNPCRICRGLVPVVAANVQYAGSCTEGLVKLIWRVLVDLVADGVEDVKEVCCVEFWPPDTTTAQSLAFNFGPKDLLCAIGLSEPVVVRVHKAKPLDLRLGKRTVATMLPREQVQDGNVE